MSDITEIVENVTITETVENVTINEGNIYNIDYATISFANILGEPTDNVKLQKELKKALSYSIIFGGL